MQSYQVVSNRCRLKASLLTNKQTKSLSFLKHLFLRLEYTLLFDCTEHKTRKLILEHWSFCGSIHIRHGVCNLHKIQRKSDTVCFDLENRHIVLDHQHFVAQEPFLKETNYRLVRTLTRQNACKRCSWGLFLEEFPSRQPLIRTAQQFQCDFDNPFHPRQSLCHLHSITH